MNTTHILEFITLAQNCNFQESASTLNISQPTLSKHIKMLEDELGCVLFTRTTRSVALTEYGSLFYEFALRYQAIYDDYVSNTNRIRLQSDQNLSVAYDPILGSYRIIELLSEFAHQHPDISLNMIESRQPMDVLKSHGCNYIVASSPKFPYDHIEYTPYTTDCLSLILPSNHPLSSQSSVHVGQLRNETLITYTDSFGEIKMFLELCHEHKFEPANVIKAIFKSNAIKMVRQGVGISVASQHQMQDSELFDTSHVRIIDMDPKTEFQICFMRLKGHKRTPAENAFFNFIQTLSTDQRP